MKSIKNIVIYLCIIFAVGIVVRYYPVQMEVVSNAWEDDISPELQCYFDVGEGFVEENSINSSQRTISNDAFIVSIDSLLYEQASNVRINFKKYSEKLFEDTKALELDCVVFKKMGIPFFLIREFEPDKTYSVDAVWEDGKLVINGPYPSVVLMENVMAEFQNKVLIINAAFMAFIVIAVVIWAFLWQKVLRKKICLAEKMRYFKEEIIIRGQVVQPFLFLIFFCINYFCIKSANMQRNFIVLVATMLLAVCIFLYHENIVNKRKMVIIINYGASLLLAAMQKKMEVYYYIPIILIIVFVFGKMSITKCTSNDSRIYKKVTRPEIIAVVIMTISYLAVLCYHLEANPRMTMDETYALHVGEGILQTGEWVKWDFVNKCSWGEYGRAWIYYAITAFFYKVFGTDIIVARAVSVFFGVLFVPVVYYIIRKFYSCDVAILSTIAICANPTIIISFRTARMYSMVLCVSIALIYCCFNAIVLGNQFKHENRLTLWIKENFDYNIKYLIATFVLLFVSYVVHMNTVILVVGFAAFIIIQAVATKEKKYIVATRIVCAGVLAVGFIFVLNNRYNAFYDNVLSKVSDFANVITILETPMESYFWSFLSAVGGIALGIGLTLITLFRTIDRKNQKNTLLCRKWNVYILTLEIAVLFVFIFMANHYAAERYAIFILPIVLCVITQGYLYLCEQYQSKVIQGIMVLIFLSFSLEGYFQEFENLYQGHPGASNYEKEAETVAKDTDEKEIALYASSFSPYHYRMFEDINIAKYVYEEENNGNKKNLQDFVEFALDNNEGYITIERRNLEAFCLMAEMAKWMTQIGGDGYDNSNIDVYKYHFISENIEQASEISFGDYLPYEGISFRWGTSGAKQYLEVSITDEELLESEFIAIRIRFENDKEGYLEGYQLHMEGSQRSKTYLIELEPRMDDVEEYGVVEAIGICDSDFNLMNKEIIQVTQYE